jgi:predicted Zn-dependent peptidase
MSYVLDMGTDHNKKLKIAVDYLKFLGTKNMSASQKLEEFYKLGCDLSVNTNSKSTKVTLTGLSSNYKASLSLLENILSNAVGDEFALESLKSTYEKQKSDAKLNKQTILFTAMTNYARYGENSSFTNKLSSSEIKEVTSKELLDIIHSLTSNEHRVLYYGPERIEDIKNLISENHNISNLKAIKKTNLNIEREMNSNQIYVVDYDMKQAEIIMYARGAKLNKKKYPIIKFHNEYFGGGMSSIVFQDLRESKALAYSVYSTYTIPKTMDDSHFQFSYIGTQSDKLSEALEGMLGLLTQMPEATANFENAKEAVLQKIKTERITKQKVIDYYEASSKINIDYDQRKDLYEKVSSFSMEDLREFHNSHVQNDSYTYMVLGSLEELDMDVLRTYGDVNVLTLEDVFGY